MKTTIDIKDRERLISTWERAFKLILRTKKQYQKRLAELQSWDKMNDEVERNCKIQALKNLL